MRIEVVAEGTIDRQARTYAEYRVFDALTQFSEADKVQRVRVLLRAVKRRGDESIACTVILVLEGSAPCRIRTIGRHAYAAINCAVDRLRSSAATGTVTAPLFE